MSRFVCFWLGTFIYWDIYSIECILSNCRRRSKFSWNKLCHPKTFAHISWSRNAFCNILNVSLRQIITHHKNLELYKIKCPTNTNRNADTQFCGATNLKKIIYFTSLRLFIRSIGNNSLSSLLCYLLRINALLCRNNRISSACINISHAC